MVELLVKILLNTFYKEISSEELVKEERYRTNNIDNPAKKDFIRVPATYLLFCNR